MIYRGYHAAISPWGLIWIFDRGRRVLTWAEALNGRRFNEKKAA